MNEWPRVRCANRCRFGRQVNFSGFRSLADERGSSVLESFREQGRPGSLAHRVDTRSSIPAVLSNGSLDRAKDRVFGRRSRSLDSTICREIAGMIDGADLAPVANQPRSTRDTRSLVSEERIYVSVSKLRWTFSFAKARLGE